MGTGSDRRVWQAEAVAVVGTSGGYRVRVLGSGKPILM